MLASNAVPPQPHSQLQQIKGVTSEPGYSNREINDRRSSNPNISTDKLAKSSELAHVPTTQQSQKNL